MPRFSLLGLDTHLLIQYHSPVNGQQCLVHDCAASLTSTVLKSREWLRVESVQQNSQETAPNPLYVSSSLLAGTVSVVLDIILPLIYRSHQSANIQRGLRSVAQHVEQTVETHAPLVDLFERSADNSLDFLTCCSVKVSLKQELCRDLWHG